jgi:uncharacterized membrane protein
VRTTFDFVKTTILGGLLVIVPVVAVALLVGRLLATVFGALAPIAGFLPGGFFLREIASLAIVLGVCFLAGVAVRTRLGQGLRNALERRLARVPGFTLVRSLARRVAGEEEGSRFQVALAEIEEALVPAFLIEEHDDGSFTVFVPAVPTPAAGALYILPRERVHPVDVPFATAVSVFTRWGEGTGELLRAMRAREGRLVPGA